MKITLPPMATNLTVATTSGKCRPPCGASDPEAPSTIMPCPATPSWVGVDVKSILISPRIFCIENNS